MRLAEQGDDVSAHVRTHQAIGSAVIETDSLQPRSAMAIYATQAKRVSDQMFIEAASAVVDQVSPQPLKRGLLYPLQSNILERISSTALCHELHHGCKPFSPRRGQFAERRVRRQRNRVYIKVDRDR
jgi:hypothetical protein